MMTPDEYERWYASQQRKRKSDNGPLWIMAGVVFIVGFALVGWILVDTFPRTAEAPATTKPQIGNVGGQAPASVRSGIIIQSIATPIPGVALNEATAQAQFDAAVEDGNQSSNVNSVANPTPVLGALPLNSAGAPIIDSVQQQQLNQSAEMAAQEAMQAQQAQRNADADSRAPDVSYEDAKVLLGRDPCHVPRANPYTCDRGLYKPTPVE